MKVLRDGLRRYYPNSEIAYSVKTNYLSDILRQVLAAGYRLEVVSRHELALARSIGARPAQVLFNGPVKNAADLALCRGLGIELNADSVDELELAASLASADRPFRIGVRVAAALGEGQTSRFGVDFDDPDSLARVRLLLAAGSIQIAGLHIHHSSRRDAQSFCDRLDRLRAVADLLDIQPEYLDLGGGAASMPPPSIAARLAYPVDSHEHLASVLGKHALAVCGPCGPRLILEPGIAVLAGAMNYVMSVVAVKSRAGTSSSAAVCDGSMFDVNPLRSAIPPPCEWIPAVEPPRVEDAIVTTTLHGATCMEIDRFDSLQGPRPRVGDLVAVGNTGAYSVCLAPEFIVERPPVYSVDQDRLLRPRQTAGQFQGAGAP